MVFPYYYDSSNPPARAPCSRDLGKVKRVPPIRTPFEIEESHDANQSVSRPEFNTENKTSKSEFSVRSQTSTSDTSSQETATLYRVHSQDVRSESHPEVETTTKVKKPSEGSSSRQLHAGESSKIIAEISKRSPFKERPHYEVIESTNKRESTSKPSQMSYTSEQTTQGSGSSSGHQPPSPHTNVGIAIEHSASLSDKGVRTTKIEQVPSTHSQAGDNNRESYTIDSIKTPINQLIEFKSTKEPIIGDIMSLKFNVYDTLPHTGKPVDNVERIYDEMTEYLNTYYDDVDMDLPEIDEPVQYFDEYGPVPCRKDKGYGDYVNCEYWRYNESNPESNVFIQSVARLFTDYNSVFTKSNTSSECCLIDLVIVSCYLKGVKPLTLIRKFREITNSLSFKQKDVLANIATFGYLNQHSLLQPCEEVSSGVTIAIAPQFCFHVLSQIGYGLIPISLGIHVYLTWLRDQFYDDEEFESICQLLECGDD